MKANSVGPIGIVDKNGNGRFDFNVDQITGLGPSGQKSQTPTWEDIQSFKADLNIQSLQEIHGQRLGILRLYFRELNSARKSAANFRLTHSRTFLEDCYWEIGMSVVYAKELGLKPAELIRGLDKGIGQEHLEGEIERLEERYLDTPFEGLNNNIVKKLAEIPLLARALGVTYDAQRVESLSHKVALRELLLQAEKEKQEGSIWWPSTYRVAQDFAKNHGLDFTALKRYFDNHDMMQAASIGDEDALIAKISTIEREEAEQGRDISTFVQIKWEDRHWIAFNAAMRKARKCSEEGFLEDTQFLLRRAEFLAEQEKFDFDYDEAGRLVFEASTNAVGRMQHATEAWADRGHIPGTRNLIDETRKLAHSYNLSFDSEWAARTLALARQNSQVVKG